MTSEQNATPRKYADVNAVVGGLLRDLARQDLDHTLAERAVVAGCVVNCWPADRLLGWLSDRSSANAGP